MQKDIVENDDAAAVRKYDVEADNYYKLSDAVVVDEGDVHKDIQSGKDSMVVEDG